jgi:uncharacterized protein with HEPN domain
MLEAIREAQEFVKGKTRSSLDHDRMLVLSLVKEIEIIGEAASKISQETRLQHSSVPWEDIVGMRNHLVHGYYDVDLDVVWDTVTQDLQTLIQLLRPLAADSARK